MKKADIELFIFAMLGGSFVSFALIVNLLCDNKYVGAFLFSFALVCVIGFKINLITGTFSKITLIENKVKTSIIVFMGNFVGTFFVGASYRYVYKYEQIAEKATEYLTAKVGQSMLSLFIMSILCGIFIGVAIWAQYVDMHETTKLYITIFAVVFFIMIGADHCVANMSLIHLLADYSGKNMFFLLQNTIGNLAGGILVSASCNYILVKRHNITVHV